MVKLLTELTEVKNGTTRQMEVVQRYSRIFCLVRDYYQLAWEVDYIFYHNKL